MKAIWDYDYDLWAKDDEDGKFLRPMCPRCHEPIGKTGGKDDSNYYCYNCGEVVEVEDAEMKEWFAEREGTKTEIRECYKIDIEDGLSFGCGKNTMEVHYYKDPRTKEWRCAGGECSDCGVRFIV